MNSGKKIARGEVSQEKKKKARSAQGGKVGTGTKALIGVLAAVAVVMVIYIVWENHHPKYLVSVDGKKATLEDMMYDVYEVEEAYGYMASFYSQLGYGDYWSTEVSEGVTVMDEARQECQDSYVQGKILYDEALENGYEVTEEDKEEARTAFDAIKGESTQDTVLGFSEEELLGILEERQVGSRYKEDLIAGYGVTDADVVGSVDKEQYRQYDIEYFTISLETTDEEGNSVAVDDVEKSARYQKLADVLASAEGKEWSEVIEEPDEDAADDGETEGDAAAEEVLPTYDSDGFIESESSFADDITAKIVAMQNGDVSEILESDGAYYVVRMVNNNSTERYESELESAIEDEEQARFQADYDEMSARHKVKIYDKEWEQVQLGSLSAETVAEAAGEGDASTDGSEDAEDGGDASTDGSEDTSAEGEEATE